MLETHLNKTFNLDSFRIGQKSIIEAILQKKDTLAVLPTGGGKSLCYQFPATYLNQLVIVVSPLIALMKDQVQNLRNRNINCGALYSGQSDLDKIKIFNDMKKNEAYLLYLSPERIQKEGFQSWIKFQNVALFAIDEAHCVSQWGHDFREEYAALKILKDLRPDVPVLALTASATPMVLDDISKNLKLDKPLRMVHGFYRPNLYYQVETCIDDDEKFEWILSALKQFSQGRILIYCGTRKVTESLAASLSLKFESVGFYHAGMPSEQRHQIQREYSQGQIRILVATNAFGMGIDQPDVRLVVHYQMPANIDSLYQEMGRAGRDNLPSTCLLLYSKKDKGLQSFFITSSDAKKSIKDLRWRNLEALINYSEASECRHSEILTYFKDAKRIKTCGHCDVCDENSGRKILKTVIQTTSMPVLKKKSESSKSNPYDLPLTATQEKQFLKLKAWRKEKAQQLDIPAFVVFGDKTLREIAQQNPRSLADLQKIYGIGESKIEKYGSELLLLTK